MLQTRRYHPFWLLSLWCCAMMGAAPFEVNWSTVDGGGATRSAGGAFEVSGSVGQPDAHAMSGGRLQLTGGFWFALDVGDCDENGGVGLSDHAALERCLRGPSTAIEAGCRCFDVNSSGTVDLADFARTQIGFSGA